MMTGLVFYGGASFAAALGIGLRCDISHLPLQRASLIIDLPLSFITDIVYRPTLDPRDSIRLILANLFLSLSFPHGEKLPIDRGPAN